MALWVIWISGMLVLGIMDGNPNSTLDLATYYTIGFMVSLAIRDRNKED